MAVFSLPYEPRKLEATEARLEAIYHAARNGLRGEALALASGMTPIEYRALCEFDPLAALAAEKGRADGEMEMSKVLHDAARAGDAKAALDVLKHVHGWVAKQAVQVEVNQTISITSALQEAQRRVIEGMSTYDVIDGKVSEAEDADTSTGPLTKQLERQANGYEQSYANPPKTSSDV
jgi:hypothetical protein